MLRNQSTQISTEEEKSEEPEIGQNEIGLAISHYHHKLGPRFVGISYNFTTFDSLNQYNILQDSISSRSDELALFLPNKFSERYMIHIKKIKLLDPKARGGVQRYAVLLFIPENVKLSISIHDIAEDLKEKLSMSESIENVLRAWHTLLNDMKGVISPEVGQIKIY
ncbi:MAG: hypothetical protein ACTSWY_16080 [Promethearchaeota archaeon]